MFGRKPRTLQRFTGQDVVIHTIQGPSLRGTLFGADGDAVCLVQVTHLDQDAELAGQIGVPWSNVLNWQILPPGELA